MGENFSATTWGQMRDYDIVVYGATGFTGGLVAEYLASQPMATFRFAIAGRSRDKLDQIKNRLESSGVHSIDILIASSSDSKSLEEMSSRTAVVISTVGPFMKYGRPLVDACLKTKTHYIDSTGETPFVKKYSDELHSEAKKAGVKLVSFCGFDSIPSDLGTFHLVNQMREAFGKDLNVDVVECHTQVKGGVSGGTIASMANLFESPVAEMRKKHYLNANGNPGCKTSVGMLVHKTKDMNGWNYPWLMGMGNAQVVRKSQSLLVTEDYDGMKPYTVDGFRYMEYGFSKSLVQAVLQWLMLIVLVFLMSFRWTRNFVTRMIPAGTGPSKAQRDSHWFKFTLIGKCLAKKKEMRLLIKGGDPGYSETAKMLAESALAIVVNSGDLPKTYGCITPAVAFGDCLVERLDRVGLTFRIQK